MKYLELDPLHFWQRLVYMDQYNYAGLEIVQQDPDSIEQDEAGAREPPLAPELAGMAVQMQWDIAEHLPRKWKQLFVELITDFLCKPLIFRKKQLSQYGSETDAQAVDEEEPRSSSQVPA